MRFAAIASLALGLFLAFAVVWGAFLPRPAAVETPSTARTAPPATRVLIPEPIPAPTTVAPTSEPSEEPAPVVVIEHDDDGHDDDDGESRFCRRRWWC